MAVSYNLRSPAVKRLMKEAQELREPTELYFAQPLEDNLFEWHFTIRGPDDSDFEGGIYHGRIILPTDYPMKPPNIVLLTPNGRFDVGIKVCLSISGYHPETWQPSWSIRTALLALIGFYPSAANGAIGGLDYSRAERQQLAKKSVTWKCETCGEVALSLKPHLPVHKAESGECSSGEASATPANSSNETQEKAANVETSSSAVTQSNAAVSSTSPATSQPNAPFSPDAWAAWNWPQNAASVLPFNPPTFTLPSNANASAASPPGYPPAEVLAEWRAYYERFFSQAASPYGFSPFVAPVNFTQFPSSFAANSTNPTSVNPTQSIDSSPSSSTAATAAATATTATTTASTNEPIVANANVSTNANVAGNEARVREPEHAAAPRETQPERSPSALERFDYCAVLIRICIVLFALLAARRFLLIVTSADDDAHEF